jgi:tetratricopeptide (TPR) repeat protein
MGVVLKARHLVLGWIVAVKLPLPAVLENEENRGRFLREAQTASSLSHPNICPIYEVGQSRAGPFISMAYIEGEPLHHWAAEHHPSARDSARLVATLARAAAYAHSQGVLHRDIKPSNVMIEAATGRPVLMDFGLAKRASAEDARLTQTGQVMGTPAYMSPEQAAGHGDEIGPLADVYSLGSVLYELLCGRPPFQGNAAEVFVQVQTVEPPAPRRLAPQLHRDVETICLKAMAKRSGDRYGSAEDLAADLERFAAGEAILARRRALAVKLALAAARRPMVTALVTTAVLVLLASAYLLSGVLRQSRANAALLSLDAAIETNDWSLDHLDEIDLLLKRVERHSPDQAEAGRRLVVDRFAASIERDLTSPTIAEQESRLTAAIDLLKARDPERAAGLAARLRRRIPQWDTASELAPPFTSLADVFDPKEVSIEGSSLTASGAAARSGIVYTRIPSRGACDLRVTFHASWADSPLVGVVLRAAGESRGHDDKKSDCLDNLFEFEQQAYHFLLHTARSEGQHRATFNESRKQGAVVSLAIHRGRECLRRREVPAASLPAGPLRLSAKRTGHDLRLEIDNLGSIEFRDAFSYSSRRDHVLAVCWPKAGRVLDLRARKQRVPEAPSPLEQGDELFEQARFSDAERLFEMQSGQDISPEHVQAARYKQAVCLLASGRNGEAERLLGQLAVETGDQWPLLAACRLWRLRFEEHRWGDVDDLCDIVVSRYKPDAITRVVPEFESSHLWGSYVAPAVNLGIFDRNPRDRVERLERGRAAAEAFQASFGHQNSLVHQLCRALVACGQVDRALQTAKKYLSDVRPAAPWVSHVEATVFCDYVWTLRAVGRTPEALKFIDEWQAATNGTLSPRVTLERARCLYAAGQLEEAADVLEDLASQTPSEAHDYRWWPACCAMRGLLREQRGDRSGATEIWRQARSDGWAKSGMGTVILDGLLAASLADDVSDADIQALEKCLGNQSGASPLALVLTSVGKRMFPSDKMRAIANGAFRSPRGRVLAPKMAFRLLLFDEHVRSFPILFLYEFMRQDAMPASATDEQDTMVWDTAEQLWKAAMEKESLEKDQGKPASKAASGKRTLQKQDLPLLFLAWGGSGPGYLGWAAVSPRLAPELRGPLAYVLGLRYRRMDRHSDAEALFRAALADAPAKGPLRKLAEDELKHGQGAKEPNPTRPAGASGPR